MKSKYKLNTFNFFPKTISVISLIDNHQDIFLIPMYTFILSHMHVHTPTQSRRLYIHILLLLFCTYDTFNFIYTNESLLIYKLGFFLSIL